MPIPKPRSDEDKDEFHERCMSDEIMINEYPDTEQRNSVCFRQWSDHKGDGMSANDNRVTSGDNRVTSGDSRVMPVEPTCHSVLASGKPSGVDREARMLRGFVVAQKGEFKSFGRGEFDDESLAAIVKLGNAAPRGLKSRFGHMTMSDDSPGKHLGRVREFVMSKALDSRTGKQVKAVRANLYFDPSASKTPHGDLAGYVMDQAESDSDALSSSLVLEADEEYRIDKDGIKLKGEDGEPLPPLWRPTKLHGSDIVDTGDAVDGLLSAEEVAKALSVGLTPDLARVLRFDNVARLATQLLDGMFAGQKREVVEARCAAWLGRYLAWRFGAKEPPEPTPILDRLRRRIDAMAALAKTNAVADRVR